MFAKSAGGDGGGQSRGGAFRITRISKLFALPDDAEEGQSGEEFYSLDFGNARDADDGQLVFDGGAAAVHGKRCLGEGRAAGGSVDPQQDRIV